MRERGDADLHMCSFSLTSMSPVDWLHNKVLTRTYQSKVALCWELAVVSYVTVILGTTVCFLLLLLKILQERRLGRLHGLSPAYKTNTEHPSKSTCYCYQTTRVLKPQFECGAQLLSSCDCPAERGLQVLPVSHAHGISSAHTEREEATARSRYLHFNLQLHDTWVTHK